jgi:hypothetical protein
MKRLLVILAALAMLTPALYARLGETLEQSIARYGQPIRHSDESGGFYVFDKNGVTIEAYFIDGVCEKIDYAADEKSTNEFKSLDDAQINAFKEIECFPNQTWQLESKPADGPASGETKEIYKVAAGSDYRVATVTTFAQNASNPTVAKFLTVLTRKFELQDSGVGKGGF